jgi:hypothetical protein
MAERYCLKPTYHKWSILNSYGNSLQGECCLPGAVLLALHGHAGLLRGIRAIYRPLLDLPSELSCDQKTGWGQVATPGQLTRYRLRQPRRPVCE